jgi:sugar lactone lactonase YvrE
MPRQLQAELLDGMGAVLGEGPTWDPRTAELLWLDIMSGQVFVHDSEGRHRTTFEIGGHVSSVLPTETTGWLVTTADGFAVLEPDGAVRSVLDVEANAPDIRFNDAKCDPWGQALAGTMRYDETAGSAHLYRLEATNADQPGSPLTVRTLLAHLGLANGLGWSSDGATLFFADSLARTVTRYPYRPDDDLGPGHQVVGLSRADGLPDGLCMDTEGNLWVAIYGGGAVHRFRPDGRLDTVVHLPVPNVTSVAFGGSEGSRLFITTAGGQGRSDPSGAGGLWAVDPGVSGPPPTLWCNPRQRLLDREDPRA